MAERRYSASMAGKRKIAGTPSTKFTQYLADLVSMSRKCGNAEQAAKKHEALKADDAMWSVLTYVGIQETGPGEERLELRNCPTCGSTLARVVRSIQR